MGSNSLEGSIRLAQTSNDYSSAPDLDDSLVHQALSVYQSERDRAGNLTNRERTTAYGDIDEVTSNSASRANYEKAGCFISNDIVRQLREDFSPGSPAVLRNPFDKFEPRPVDEKVVSCSARVRIEQEPRMGCSTQIRIDIDVPNRFYLCSAHITIGPEAKPSKPDIDLCVARIHPFDPKRPDIDLCVAKIRPWEPHNQRVPDEYLCVSKIGPRWPSEPQDPDAHLCASRIRPSVTPRNPDIVLCVDRFDPLKPSPTHVDRCISRINPGEPQHIDVTLCSDRIDLPSLQPRGVDQLLGCGRKVPGEPGMYRKCSATAPKEYIPEFLEYEKQARKDLLDRFQKGEIDAQQYRRNLESWDK